MSNNKCVFWLAIDSSQQASNVERVPPATRASFCKSIYIAGYIVFELCYRESNHIAECIIFELCQYVLAKPEPERVPTTTYDCVLQQCTSTSSAARSCIFGSGPNLRLVVPSG